ncbi:MAG: NHL repeat-containing protein [Planctomycetota bacterium]|jgi:hypothetical protein
MRRLRKLVLRTVAVILVLLGSAGWFGGFFAHSLEPDYVDRNTQLPLGWLEGVAVDNHGRIYCGLQFYSRIQVYDADGRFLRGWFLDAAGGVFRLRISKSGQLEVATVRNDMLYTYNADGELVEKRTQAGHLYGEFGAESEYLATGPDGAEYRAKGFPWPRIVKRDASGASHTVVSVPIHLWFMMGPLPAWGFSAIGIVLLLGTDKRFTKEFKKVFKKRRGEPSTS